MLYVYVYIAIQYTYFGAKVLVLVSLHCNAQQHLVLLASSLIDFKT